MRFATRYDTWLVAVLYFAGTVSIALPLAMYFSHALPVRQMWIFLLGPVVLALVLLATLPQYYEVRGNGLFLRQGWRKALLPYAELRALRAERGMLSAPVFSTRRIYIEAAHSSNWIIAVAEQERFLAEVFRHAPQLKGSGTKTDA
jgi:hypothetical protein